MPVPPQTQAPGGYNSTHLTPRHEVSQKKLLLLSNSGLNESALEDDNFQMNSALRLNYNTQPQSD